MCGRFALYSTGDVLQARFGLDAVPHVQPSYNVAPGATIPVFAWSREREPRLLPPAMFWGFPGKDAGGFINARAETVREKPAFRSAWQMRRCAIPFDAFYEWAKRRQPKEPWCFKTPGRPLAFGGIYWPLPEPVSGARYGFAILTTEPSRDVAEIHHRMPVILQPDEVAFFSAPDTSQEQLRDLCRTPPADVLERRRAPSEIAGTGIDGPWLMGSPGTRA